MQRNIRKDDNRAKRENAKEALILQAQSIEHYNQVNDYEEKEIENIKFKPTPVSIDAYGIEEKKLILCTGEGVRILKEGKNISVSMTRFDITRIDREREIYIKKFCERNYDHI